MRVKFGILIDVEATLSGVRVTGPESVVLEMAVGSKPASIAMTNTEARILIDALKSAGVSGAVTLGSVVLPKARP